MEDVPILKVRDEAGRTLDCYREQIIPIDEAEYALLTPVDTPVTLFTWEGDDEEPIMIEDEEEIEAVFPTAQAVLAERNLNLVWSAVTLTVEGETASTEEDDDDDLLDLADESSAVNGFEPIDELETEDDEDDDDEDDDDGDEFQLLATFYHGETEYGLYIPLDAFFIVARMAGEEPQLLSPEEFEAIAPALEAELEARMS
jgi:hypothetical protein